MVSSIAVGYITAVLAAVFNGSFGAFSKIRAIEQANVPPLLFQFYACIGIFLSSWIAIPLAKFNKDITSCAESSAGCADIAEEFSFTNMGLIAGALLVLALYFSFAAISKIGLSLAQGIWGGTAVLVSFSWGVIAFPKENHISIIWLAAVALPLLMVGIIGIAYSEAIAEYLWPKTSEDMKLPIEGVTSPYMSLRFEGNTNPQESPVLSHDASNKPIGIMYAMLVGLFGGSILVPMQFVHEQQGIVFLPSFGTGALLAASTLCIFSYGIVQRKNPFTYASKDTVWLTIAAGIACGVVWNVGNAMSILGIPRIGYSIAYPIMQCALLFSGLWGIFAFHEIQGKSIGIFFAFSLVLLGGAVLLALSR